MLQHSTWQEPQPSGESLTHRATQWWLMTLPGVTHPQYGCRSPSYLLFHASVCVLYHTELLLLSTSTLLLYNLIEGNGLYGIISNRCSNGVGIIRRCVVEACLLSNFLYVHISVYLSVCLSTLF